MGIQRRKRMGRHKIELPVTAAELRKLYEVHQLTLQQIADRLGCHYVTVYNKLADAGIPRRRKWAKKRNLNSSAPYIPANKKPISTDCIKVMYLKEGKS